MQLLCKLRCHLVLFNIIPHFYQANQVWPRDCLNDFFFFRRNSNNMINIYFFFFEQSSSRHLFHNKRRESCDILLFILLLYLNLFHHISRENKTMKMISLMMVGSHYIKMFIQSIIGNLVYIYMWYLNLLFFKFVCLFYYYF